MGYFGTRRFSFTAISEQSISNGSSFGRGDSFVFTGADSTFHVRDNDRGLHGDFFRNERGDDRQKGWVEQDGELVRAGNIYAEQVHILRGSDGGIYFLVEIEGTRLSNDPAQDDFFTFFGNRPEVGVELTAIASVNVFFPLHYGSLGAGDTSLPIQAVDDALTVDQNEGADGTDINLLINDDSGSATALVVGEVNGDPALVGVFFDLAEGGRILVAANGDVDFDADGDFTALGVGETAEIAIDYTATGTDGSEDDGRLTITVTGVNDGPVAVDDVTTTDEDTSVSIVVLDNDSDVDGDALTVTAASAANGSVVVEADGSLTYAPSADFNGTDTISYTIADGNGGTDTAEVAVTVNAVNDGPVAVDDAVTLDEDTSANISVLGNDSDVDSDALTVTAASATNGTVVIETDGSLTYTPNANFHGSDTISYTIDDGNGGTDTAEVAVTVVNDNADILFDEGDNIVDFNDVVPTDYADDGNTQNGFAGDDHVTLARDAAEAAEAGVTPDDLFSGGEGNDTILGGDLADNIAGDAGDDLIEGGGAGDLIDGGAGDDRFVHRFGDGNDTVEGGDGIDQMDILLDSGGSAGFGPGGQLLSINAASTVAEAIQTNSIERFNFIGTDGDEVVGTDNAPSGTNFSADMGTGNDSVQTSDGADTLFGGSGNDQLSADGNGSGLTSAGDDLVFGGDGDDTITAAFGNNTLHGDDGADLISTGFDDDQVFAGSGDDSITSFRGNDTIDGGDGGDQVRLSGDSTDYTLLRNADGSVTATDTRLPAGTATKELTAVEKLVFNDGMFFIDGTNNGPVAQDDAAATDEDTSVSIDVLSNDRDFDDDTLSVTAASAINGSVVIEADGSLTYTPDADFNGSDTISYTVSDGNGGADTAEVTVTVNAVNDAPIAADDTFTANENAAIGGNLGLNDSDPEGDPISLVSVNGDTSPTNLLVTADNGMTIRVDAFSTGPAGFFANLQDGDALAVGETANATLAYTITDGALTDTANISLSFTGVNDGPVASDDTASTDEDVAVSIDVLGNDTDIDGDDLTVTAAAADNGTVVIEADGSLTYTPDANFNGSDTISYAIADGNGGTDSAEVAVSVAAVNDAPVAVDQVIAGTENVVGRFLLDFNGTDPDGDTVRISTINGRSADSFLTIPTDAGFLAMLPSGPSSAPVFDFSLNNDDNTASSDVLSAGEEFNIVLPYTVTDGSLNSTANLLFTFVGTNDPVTANDDTAATDEDVPIVIDVLANDVDPDRNDVLTIQTAVAQNGAVAINADGTLTYTPNDDFHGQDIIDYTVSDGNGSSDTAQVTVTVNEVNFAPNAVDDSFTGTEDGAIVGSLGANDSDPDGDALTLVDVNGDTSPTNLLVTADNGMDILINAFGLGPAGFFASLQNGDALAAGETANATLTYTISDGALTDTASISLSFTGVNDAPDAADDVLTVDQNGGGADILANDSDAEGDGLTIIRINGQDAAHEDQPLGPLIVVQSQNGRDALLATRNDDFFSSGDFQVGTGAFDDLGAGETDTINTTYTISDGNGGTDTANISITVTGQNDAVTANDDAVSVNEDAIVTFNVLGNDVDIDTNDVLTVIAAEASNGVVTVNASGTLTYRPDADFNGADTITYTVSDGNGSTDTAEVAVTVNPSNDAPTLGFAQAFFDTTNISLSDLRDGEDGFVLDASGFANRLGGAVSGVGDVNGDGIDDVAIGATGGGGNGAVVGESYVVFGGQDLSEIRPFQIGNGVDGFVINGAGPGAALGSAISGAGDLNGDGLADIIVGANGIDDAGFNSGGAFVVYGKTDQGAVNISNIAAGNGGFSIIGASEGDSAGSSVSAAGDVNGDGLDDLLIGAPFADSYGTQSGAAYVVFGTGDNQQIDLSNIDALVGNGGFAIRGFGDRDFRDTSVAGAGDVNGDGLADVIVGSRQDDVNGTDSGAAYVVFGKTDSNLVRTDDIQAGIGGFAINGTEAGDQTGFAVGAAGDVNGDGLADLVVGSPGAPGGSIDGPAALVVFGKTDGAVVDHADIDAGIGGFAIRTDDLLGGLGEAVSGAGDVNGDGLDDLIVGAPQMDQTGASFVVLGKADGDTINISDIKAGTGGFAINGEADGDDAGSAVSGAGDVNGDGLADLIVGARGSEVGGLFSGTAYVVFAPEKEIRVEDFSEFPEMRTDEDEPVAIRGLSISDIDVDQGAAEFSVNVSAENGQFILGGDGVTIQNGFSDSVTITGPMAAINTALAEFFYVPDENFNGTETVTVTVDDLGNIGVPGSLTDVESFEITVNPTPDAPDAVDDSFVGTEQGAIVGSLGANDSDPDGDAISLVNINGDTSPSNLPVIADNGMTILVTAFGLGPAGFFASLQNADALAVGETANATLSYTISDGALTDTANISLTFTGVNDAPVAVDDSVTTNQNVPVGINVLANDSDIDGDSLTVTAATAANGTVSIGANGVLTYQNDAGFASTDTIDYTIADGNGGTDTAQVTVTVNSIAPPPREAPTWRPSPAMMRPRCWKAAVRLSTLVPMTVTRMATRSRC